jgi:hypothetical protein
LNLGGDVRATGKVVGAGALHASEAHPAPRTGLATAAATLSLRARILLWDFERGSLAYDLLCLFLVLLLLLIPAAWWGDPMVRRP